MGYLWVQRRREDLLVDFRTGQALVSKHFLMPVWASLLMLDSIVVGAVRVNTKMFPLGDVVLLQELLAGYGWLPVLYLRILGSRTFWLL